MMVVLKNKLLQWLMFFFAKRKCGGQNLDQVKTIALWQFGGVGDMLLATPVILSLSKRFPEATIQIWCSNPPFAQFLLHFECVSSIHAFRVYDFDMRTMLKTKIRQTLQSIRHEMHANKPDLIVNLHVPALLDWWAVEWLLLHQLKPRYTLGFDPIFIEKTSIFDTSINAKFREGQHYTKLYQQLLLKADMQCVLETQFPTDDKEQTLARSLLATVGIQKKQPWVCMHIGGRRLKVENKMWPIASFAELANKLLGEGILPVLIGVDGERVMGEDLCNIVPKVVNLIGKTSIGEMAALIKLSSGFVGHDSGPFHVAVAVNTPAVAICGRPDAEPEYLAYDKNRVAVLIAESPQMITVDDVFSSVTAMLHD